MTKAEAAANLAEAMKCRIAVNEGGELQRAANAEQPFFVTVTLDSPSRHLQRVIEALSPAIAAATKAGVDATELELARLWLKDLQVAEAKAAEKMRLALKGRGVLRVRLLRGEG